MRIGIDARFYGVEHTGLGRYTKNVLLPLTKYLHNHELVVFLRDPYYSRLKFGKNVRKVRCNLPHYSVQEQLLLPNIIKKHHLDLWFSFHFNTPIFSRVPKVTVIHDLIKTHSTGPDTTTRAPWLYALKRLGYTLAIKHAVRRSRALIVPTNTVKNDLLAEFNERPEKIHPIHEAPDPALKSKILNPKSMNLPSKFILFVGNSYLHKNLSTLLKAIGLLPRIELVLVTSTTPYLRRLLNDLPPPTRTRITIITAPSDPVLVSLYRRATALIAPSLMEGFGLPGLEALVLGTPVIASDIPVFREVYGSHAVYFDPHSPRDLARSIKNVRARSSRPLDYDRTWLQVAKDIGKVVDESCAPL